MSGATQADMASPGEDDPVPDEAPAGAIMAPDGDPGAEPSIEERARRMGWVPREEYNGNPAKWRSAEEYVRRGEEVLPILQQQLRVTDGRLQAIQSEFARYKDESGRTMAEMTEALRRADARGYARALAEVEQRRQAALESGDTAGFAAADAERDRLRADAPPAASDRMNGHAPPAPPPPVAAPLPTPPPEIQAWVSANPWFLSDPVANAVAGSLYGHYERQSPQESITDRLARVRQEIARRFPEHFGNPRRAAPSPVSSPTATSARAPNPRSFDALPSVVKEQYDRWARQLAGRGKPLTKEEFAANYWEQEA